MYAKYGCQTTVALYLVCYWTTGRIRPEAVIGSHDLGRREVVAHDLNRAGDDGMVLGRDS